MSRGIMKHIRDAMPEGGIDQSVRVTIKFPEMQPDEIGVSPPFGRYLGGLVVRLKLIGVLNDLEFPNFKQTGKLTNTRLVFTARVDDLKFDELEYLLKNNPAEARRRLFGSAFDPGSAPEAAMFPHMRQTSTNKSRQQPARTLGRARKKQMPSNKIPTISYDPNTGRGYVNGDHFTLNTKKIEHFVFKLLVENINEPVTENEILAVCNYTASQDGKQIVKRDTSVQIPKHWPFHTGSPREFLSTVSARIRKQAVLLTKKDIINKGGTMSLVARINKS